MDLMTVNEFSKAFNVSVQSVYQRIKRGTLKVEIKDGLKYIQVGDNEGNNVENKDTQANCKEVIKVYKAMVKDLKKQIKDLKKDKDKNYQRLEALFDRTLNNLGFTPLLPKQEEAVEAEFEESKKKKKKKH